MQRVAIARALVNDPEILLCDEPTGALDTVTSVQIMDLIKEIAKDRLVIMVTHNPKLAETYADRVIQFQDGNIVSDTNPHEERPKADEFKLARKKDITRVFDAETCILGIFSGVLGVAVAMLCTIPINAIIFKVADLENVAKLQPSHAITLIIISTLLTVLGGHIPARMASNKDAVEALRSE